METNPATPPVITGGKMLAAGGVGVPLWLTILIAAVIHFLHAGLPNVGGPPAAPIAGGTVHTAAYEEQSAPPRCPDYLPAALTASRQDSTVVDLPPVVVRTPVRIESPVTTAQPAAVITADVVTAAPAATFAVTLNGGNTLPHRPPMRRPILFPRWYLNAHTVPKP